MFNVSVSEIKEKLKKLTKEDIVNFAFKYNVFLSKKEIDFVFDLVKNKNQELLNNHKSFNLNLYKNNFSEENFKKINNLYNKYSGYLNLIQLTD